MSLAVGGGQVGDGRTCGAWPVGKGQGCAGGIWGWVSRGCWALAILGCGKEVTALPVPQHGFGAGGNFQLLPTSIIPWSGPGRWAETRDGKPGMENQGSTGMLGLKRWWSLVSVGFVVVPLGVPKRGKIRANPLRAPTSSRSLSQEWHRAAVPTPLAQQSQAWLLQIIFFFLFKEGEYLVIPMP